MTYTGILAFPSLREKSENYPTTASGDPIRPNTADAAATAGLDDVVQLWEFGGEERRSYVLAETERAVSGLLFSADSRWLFATG